MTRSTVDNIIGAIILLLILSAAGLAVFRSTPHRDTEIHCFEIVTTVGRDTVCGKGYHVYQGADWGHPGPVYVLGPEGFAKPEIRSYQTTTVIRVTRLK